jgi:glycosyltransferase A (GT-A) superfamily protein (DUF2064 family)
VIVGALGAPLDPELDGLLGAEGARALRSELAARARRWAAATAPGHAFEATTLGAARAALHGHVGPVILAAPDVPGLDARIAAAALEDLGSGVDVVVGVTHDARPYLIGIPDVDSELAELVEGSFGGGVLAQFAERGLTLGMVRHERRLATAADARALAIDPMAPPDLVALVRPRDR